jgi:hypothetical protein
MSSPSFVIEGFPRTLEEIEKLQQKVIHLIQIRKDLHTKDIEPLQRALTEKYTLYQDDIDSLQETVSDLEVLKRHRLQLQKKKTQRYFSDDMGPDQELDKYLQSDTVQSNAPTAPTSSSSSASKEELKLQKKNPEDALDSQIPQVQLAVESNKKQDSKPKSNEVPLNLNFYPFDKCVPINKDASCTSSLSISEIKKNDGTLSNNLEKRRLNGEKIMQPEYKYLSTHNFLKRFRFIRPFRRKVTFEMHHFLNFIEKDAIAFAYIQKKFVLKNCEAFRIMDVLEDIVNHLLRKINAQEMDIMEKKDGNYTEYGNVLLANHTTIFSPVFQDALSGQLGRFEVLLEGSMLIAVAQAWNKSRDTPFSEYLDPWTLFMRLAVKAAFHIKPSKSGLKVDQLCLLSEELNRKFLVTIQYSGITEGKNEENEIKVGLSTLAELHLQWDGVHFLTGHEKNEFSAPPFHRFLHLLQRCSSVQEKIPSCNAKIYTYNDTSSVDGTTIFSPPQVDSSTGEKYCFQLMLDASILVAITDALKLRYESKYRNISPWALFIALEDRRLAFSITKGCVLDLECLKDLSGILQHAFNVYIRRNDGVYNLERHGNHKTLSALDITIFKRNGRFSSVTRS